MSEYGRRAVPAATKVLSPEALEQWRSRARKLHLGESGVAIESPAAVPQPDVSSETAADASQRRTSRRQKTLIGGKVVFDDMMTVYDCTIRDLSEGGARVKLNAPVQLPQVFMLRFNDGRIRQCKLRRRYGLELGVEFLD